MKQSKKLIIFTIIILCISISLFSQTIMENEGNLYRKGLFSITVGGMMYSPATVYNTVGSLSPENKIIPNFHVGIGYDIFRNQKTELNLFFNTNPEPVYSVRLLIPMEELPNESDHDLISYFKSYTMYSFNIGLKARRVLMEDRFGDLSISGGYTLKYFPSGFGDITVTTSFDDQHVVLYNMLFESQEKPIHHAIQFGVGQSFTFHRNHLAIDLFYNYRFNDLISGDYDYYNLKTMLPSSGKYSLSGNYFGLQVAYQRLQKI